MGLLTPNKNEDHVEYNGDNTTLLTIKRRHIKENQTIYSGSYAIKNKPVQTSITASVPLWESQPARGEVERLIYVKNDILRQMMDWVGGDWVGEVDYGKNTIITYGANEDLKQKTDWNENFDQAIADNFGMQLCTGDLPISIQMANYICWRENGLKFGDMDHQWSEKELNGYYMPMDHTSTPHKTYALGMMYTSMDGGETLTDIEKVGTLDPASIWNYWIGLAKYAANDILKHCGNFTPNQNQLDSLVRRWYSAPASCYKICARLANGESPQSVYANWVHFQDCTEKENTAGHVKTYESQRPVMTRNCEECRNWFIGMYPEEIPGLGKFEEWTYGADIVGASGGGMSGASGGGMSGVSGGGISGVNVGSGDVKIISKFLSNHITSSPNREIKYLAIHYTAGGSSSPGSAQAIYNVFSQRSASADFAVDDRDIVQFNPNLKNYYCWAIGDKGSGSLKNQATNRNTISIEICSNLAKGTSAAVPNHQGWSFTNASLGNALRLARYLMKKYNIPKERVIRHYDVTGKLCPGIVGWNNGVLYGTDGHVTNNKNNSSTWSQFKSML